MASTPQPPRPPAPPPLRQGRSHAVAIVLLGLGIIVLVSFMAVWTGLRFLARSVQFRVAEGQSGKKEVSIRTPLGGLEVNKTVDVSRLGLPIYPGATRADNEGSATVNIDLPDEHSVHVLAAKFDTPDAMDRVRDFYKGRLGDEVTKYTQRTAEGKTVFEIKRNGQEKVVALKSNLLGGGTRIELVRVVEGKGETN